MLEVQCEIVDILAATGDINQDAQRKKSTDGGRVWSCSALLSAEDNGDAFAQVLQWMHVADLRWICRVSRHWHRLVMERVRQLEIFIEQAGRQSTTPLDTLYWAVPHACQSLKQIFVGGAMPVGWILPSSFLNGIKSCVALEHLCLQGVCISPDRAGDSDAKGAVAALSGLVGLHALKSLNLCFCEQVDAAALPHLQQTLPAVELRRLPEWYLRGGGQHTCIAHPGIDESSGGAWFIVGERHTYCPAGKFVFEPRDHLSRGVVNRCWPVPLGFVLELQFDGVGTKYRPQVLIENCSLSRAISNTSRLASPSSCAGRQTYFTSAHSTRALLAPSSTPPLSTDDVTVGIWRIECDD